MNFSPLAASVALMLGMAASAQAQPTVPTVPRCVGTQAQLADGDDSNPRQTAEADGSGPRQKAEGDSSNFRQSAAAAPCT